MLGSFWRRALCQVQCCQRTETNKQVAQAIEESWQEEMSKLLKMTEVLDLFSSDIQVVTAEEIAERLRISRPTAFRYVKELTAAGFLEKLGGRYALGARVIELEYQFRHSNPVLQASSIPMRELSDMTSCGVFLAIMLGEKIFNAHIESTRDGLTLATFGRGRPLPLFRGAASKMILAHCSTSRLRVLYEAHAQEPDVRAIADTFPAFQKHFREIRKRGYYISRSEVDEGVIGVSAFIEGSSCSLVLVLDAVREQWMSDIGCARLVVDHAKRISERIAKASAD